MKSLLSRSRSIRVTMLISSLLLILLLTIALFGLFYISALNSVTNKASEYAGEITRLVSEHIDEYFRNTRNIADLIETNFDVRYYLAQVDQGRINGLSYYRGQVRKYIQSVIRTREDIVSAYVFDSELYPIGNDPEGSVRSYIDFESEEWYKSAINAGGLTTITSTHVQHLRREASPWVVSLSRVMRSAEDKFQGVVLIDINYRMITDICSAINLGQRGYVFIVDEHGKLVYHPQQQLIYSGIKSENLALIQSSQVNSFVDGNSGKLYNISNLQVLDTNTTWKIVGVSYIDEFSRDAAQSFRPAIAASVLVMFFAIIMALYMSRLIATPLSELEDQVRYIEQGHLDSEIQIIDGSREVANLSSAFSALVLRVRQLIEQNRIDQELVRQSEVKALQAQINPHFLYNTLETIIWMAEDDGNEKIVDITAALAKYFRIALSGGQEFIPIRSELEHAKSYLIIQKIRYEKLSYEFEIDPSVNEFYCMKLIVQPLIENAVYHGLRNKDDGGLIKIIAKRDFGDIMISVIDDGDGIDEKKLPTLLDLSHNDWETMRGVGLKNVHARIRLSYGESYGLSIKSRVGKGTEVSVRLPALYRETIMKNS